MPIETSIIIVTYNSENWIVNCLNSLTCQEYENDFEIVVVDNGSCDQTCILVKTRFPEINLIESSNNGFGAGNNLGAKKALGKFLVFVNPDTMADPRWLHELIKPLHKTGIVTTSKIVLMQDPKLINTCGNTLHFTGLGFVNKYLENASDYHSNFEVDGISGAAFAMRKTDYECLGGFDEDFFMYMEDVELSWRIKSAGISIICAANSIVQHNYNLKVGPDKIFALEKGRFFILRKHFRKLDWILFFPSILLSSSLSLAKSLVFSFTGLSKWLNALITGMSAPINTEHQFRTSKNTFKTRIPFELLSTNKAVLMLGSIANFLFWLNVNTFIHFGRFREHKINRK